MPSSFKRLACFILFICVSADVFAAPPTTLPADEIAAIDASVQTEMEKQHIIGAAIGVIRNGEIVYLKGYGLADREKKTSVTTHTVMNWASNSKPMAAILAMQLVDQKKLDLDADVRTYVPEFPDKHVKITPRLILCHESGMVHYSNGQVIPTERKYEVADPFADPVNSLDRFNQSPLLFQPGEKTSYSTYAYILLSAVIQRAGQQPYDDQIMSRIAKPLKMTTLQLDVATKNQPDWAVGYTKFAGAIVTAPEEANYWKHGGGAFKSDIEDFAKWAQALIKGKLVSKESRERMWTPQKLNNGQATEWGLGFGLHNTAKGLRVSHGGKQDEATSMMWIEPQAKSGVVVLCNCGFANPTALAQAVENRIQPK